MNRRLFLSTSLLPLLTNITFSKEIKNSGEKSVVLVWLGGGASSVEISNPLPLSQEEYRSTRGHIDTVVPGLELGGDFKGLASIADKLTVVRNLGGRDANHETATMEYLTSEFHVPNSEQKAPSFGSLLSYNYDSYSEKGVPRYVKVNKIQGDDAAFLGVRYAGFDVDREGVENLFPKMTTQQFDRRLEFMRNLDKSRSGNLTGQWGQLKEQAVNIIKGDVGKSFDMKYETEENKLKYGVGKSNFGRDLLLAKRLVSAGVKFVNVNIGGWDMHSDISNSFARLGTELDTYLTLFINDLYESGMADNCLVFVVSEFSRTKININAGRDHNPNVNTLIFAGGGYNHGRVIGKTDKTGLVAENPFGPKDLYYTILSHFDIDKKLTIVDNQNRPRHMFSDTARNILS